MTKLTNNQFKAAAQHFLEDVRVSSENHLRRDTAVLQPSRDLPYRAHCVMGAAAAGKGEGLWLVAVWVFWC